MKLLLLNALTLAAEAPAGEEKFDPSHEFELPAWVSIHIGPLDMSINKAVVYLWLGTALTIVIGIVLMRLRLRVTPDRRQTIGEQIYDIAQAQIAEQGLPTKAIGRWFPYVASLMLFIWTINMLGFIPLPITGETFELFGRRASGLGHLRRHVVDLSDARVGTDDVVLHALRRASATNGAGPATSRAGSPRSRRRCYPLIIPLEILGQFMRLISLSVRLFANMLAGHMLILTFIGLVFLTSSFVVGLVAGIALTGVATALLPLRGRDRRLDPGVYLRRTVRHLHRLGDRAGALRRPCRVSSLDATGDVATRARQSPSRSVSGSARSGPASASGTSSAR